MAQQNEAFASVLPISSSGVGICEYVIIEFWLNDGLNQKLKPLKHRFEAALLTMDSVKS
jgi:hypothetical protein